MAAGSSGAANAGTGVLAKRAAVERLRNRRGRSMPSRCRAGLVLTLLRVLHRLQQAATSHRGSGRPGRLWCSSGSWGWRRRWWFSGGESRCCRATSSPAVCSERCSSGYRSRVCYLTVCSGVIGVTVVHHWSHCSDSVIGVTVVPLPYCVLVGGVQRGVGRYRLELGKNLFIIAF